MRRGPFQSNDLFGASLVLAVIVLTLIVCVTITSIHGHMADERMEKACVASGGAWVLTSPLDEGTPSSEHECVAR